MMHARSDIFLFTCICTTVILYLFSNQLLGKKINKYSNTVCQYFAFTYESFGFSVTNYDRLSKKMLKREKFSFSPIKDILHPTYVIMLGKRWTSMISAN